ncbi:serine hydrolase domain-containing protein [Streptomyces sp. NPDC005506]|uniref:serine hydrolase domain-containing protein n=1 Tax=unclassified Streptomyces TaxID=2593676 RepID=UPI0036BA5E0A
MAGLSLRPVPVCVLSSSAPPLARHGHDPAAFVEIGSLTKVLTGTVLVRMVRAGLLGLDDAVEQWLPTPPGSGITLRNLADHTSGLPRLPPGLTGHDPLPRPPDIRQPEDTIPVRRPGSDRGVRRPGDDGGREAAGQGRLSRRRCFSRTGPTGGRARGGTLAETLRSR